MRCRRKYTISKRRYADASQLYDKVDALTAKWEPSRRENVASGLARISVLLSSGQAGTNAQEIARRYLERERQRSGDKSVTTAIARGYLGAALARDGKTAEALASFKEAIPVLLSVSQGADDESGVNAAAQEGRVRFVVEAYLRVLSAEAAKPEVAQETFAYADLLRGQSVQRALQASSARSAARDPAMAQVVRKRTGSAEADRRVDRRAQQSFGPAGWRARRQGRERHAGADRETAGELFQG